ncbi:MAG: MBL fold metallo-hydrolase [Anaerolineae bacterium]|nr:MBL fold metallo-hydrolase [Anaerolineae bacterium]
MILKYFYDSRLAQASYMVGCAQTGEALVIDPARDITPYLDAARAEDLRITHVTETHIHADFVSGVRELAAATGAKLYLSDMGDADWKYAFADSDTVLLHDGDSWMVGNICIEALHTPGHTPEHLCFQITDTAGANKPMGIFTGDCLFVGTVGRPDLLEEAAGIANTKEPGARQQFQNMQRLKTLPDYLQIWPGHGAGSACGKGLGAIPSTTLGYEKLFNPAFQFTDETEFVHWLLDGQPEAPRYFGQMKRVNKIGPALLKEINAPQHLPPVALPLLLKDALIIDTRPTEAFAQQHAPGTINIPTTSNNASTWAGWYVDFNKPTYFIAEETEVPEVVNMLRAIGVDNLPGYFTPDAVNGYTGKITTIMPLAAADLMQSGAYLLDVRWMDEYQTDHIPGAHHIPLGHIPTRIAELPTETPLIVQCGGGVRSQVVASLLQRRGFTNILNLSGGIDAWKRAGLPIEFN